MGGNRLYTKRNSKLVTFLCLIIFIQSTNGINLGLIAGDLKRSGPGPLVVRKVSHHSPVFINVNPGLAKLPGTALRNSIPKLPILPCLAALPPKPLPKLPAKPPPKLLKSSKLKRSPLIPSLPLLRPTFATPLLLPHLIPPVIPHLPLLPVVPSVIPPIIPPFLPFLPSPLLRAPRLPKLLPLHTLHPLKLPSLRKSPLEKALDTVKLPVANTLKNKMEKDLLDLKIKRLFSTPELRRFKKLKLK